MPEATNSVLHCTTTVQGIKFVWSLEKMFYNFYHMEWCLDWLLHSIQFNRFCFSLLTHWRAKPKCTRKKHVQVQTSTFLFIQHNLWCKRFQWSPSMFWYFLIRKSWATQNNKWWRRAESFIKFARLNKFNITFSNIHPEALNKDTETKLGERNHSHVKRRLCSVKFMLLFYFVYDEGKWKIAKFVAKLKISYRRPFNKENFVGFLFLLVFFSFDIYKRNATQLFLMNL